MKNLHFLSAALCVSSALSALLSGSLSAAAQPPSDETSRFNIVFFLVDDLGWTDLGCYGSDYYETPHIDRLAAAGIRFTDAHAACTACSPTRAAILTGAYPARLHLTDWIPGQNRPNEKLRVPEWTKQLQHGHATIAKALRQSAGYATAHVGKWHLGGRDFYPETHGFDVNIGGSRIGAPGSYYYPYHRKPSAASGPMENLPPGGPESEGRYLTDRLADESVKLIEQFKDEPFFLYHAFYSVHTPIQPRKDLLARYSDDVPPGKGHDNPTYAAMVGAVDEAVGRIVRKIDECGIAERTAIFFTSDNGGLDRVTTNSPLRGGKGQPYEGGTRVPLIVRWPGVTPAGAVCDEPVISVDFYPTILDVAGIVVGGAPGYSIQDGRSLAALLRDPDATLDRDALYWHYPHYNPIQGVPYSAIRAGRYRLVELLEDQRVELYDLQADIGETRDLSETLPEKTAALRKQLHAWRDGIGAQMPTANPDYTP